jgi:hypothetical protein
MDCPSFPKMRRLIISYTFQYDVISNVISNFETSHFWETWTVRAKLAQFRLVKMAAGTSVGYYSSESLTGPSSEVLNSSKKSNINNFLSAPHKNSAQIDVNINFQIPDEEEFERDSINNAMETGSRFAQGIYECDQKRDLEVDRKQTKKFKMQFYSKDYYQNTHSYKQDE